MKTPELKALFDDYKSSFAHKQQIELLKAIEQKVIKLFTFHSKFRDTRSMLGKSREKKQLLESAVIDSIFAGIEEFSKDFFTALGIGFGFQHMKREFIRLALTELDHGFDDFDKVLIYHATIISDFYDSYYEKWLKAVRTSEASKHIVKMQKEDPDRLHKIVKDNDLDNHYTIITQDKSGELTDCPYAVFFKQDIQSIVEIFNSLISELRKLKNLTPEQKVYIPYLKQYKKCLGIEDKSQLENEWTKLDILWMDVKYWIQIVHDIEDGYGDPLRRKIIPEFSLRFKDPTYEKENKQIEEIKQEIMEYYSIRTHLFAKEGRSALSNCDAAIYYIPFQTGMSLHHRFSGQSIPNRPEVKSKKGVKIYFDPEQTKQRIKQSKQLVKTVFTNESLEKRVDPLVWIISIIAPHEFGHAIYGLNNVEDVISSTTRAFLEEVRADLTAVVIWKQMYEKKKLSKEDLQENLFNLLASDLRRYVQYDSEPLKGYTTSAMNTCSTYAEEGYLSQEDTLLTLHEEKAVDVVQSLATQFTKILDAMEQRDGKTIEKMYNAMVTETPIITWLVDKLFKK